MMELSYLEAEGLTGLHCLASSRPNGQGTVVIAEREEIYVLGPSGENIPVVLPPRTKPIPAQSEAVCIDTFPTPEGAGTILLIATSPVGAAGTSQTSLAGQLLVLAIDDQHLRSLQADSCHVQGELLQSILLPTPACCIAHLACHATTGQPPGLDVVVALSSGDSLGFRWQGRLPVVRSEKSTEPHPEVLLAVGDATAVLPEWKQTEGSIVLDIAVGYLPGGARLTALSCDDGLIVLAQTLRASPGATPVAVPPEVCRIDGPVTSLSLLHTSLEHHPFADHQAMTHRKRMGALLGEPEAPPPVGLVACSAIGVALAFWDIAVAGLSLSCVLPVGSLGDSVVCGCAAAVPGHATSQVVIGTFESRTIVACEITPPELPGAAPTARRRWQRAVEGPVMSLVCADVTGDSLDEVLVATTQGVHILQADVQHLARLLSSAATKEPVSASSGPSMPPDNFASPAEGLQRVPPQAEGGLTPCMPITAVDTENDYTPETTTDELRHEAAPIPIPMRLPESPFPARGSSELLVGRPEVTPRRLK